MTAQKVPSLTVVGTLSLNDALYLVVDPDGSPADRRCSPGRLLSLMHYCGARLSASSSVAIPTTDVSASNNIYIHQAPDKANLIRLYDGSNWNLYTFTSGTSLSLSGSSSLPNDIFAYVSGGSVAFEYLSWTSDTARATALTTQDGILVKSGAATRLYLGTIRTVSNQAYDTMTNRYVWNYYNRRKRPFNLDYTKSGSFSYGTGSWRQYDNTSIGTRVNFCVGVLEDSVTAAIGAEVTAGNGGYVALGLNSTTGTTPAVRNSNSSSITAGQTREFYPTIGQYSLNMTEFGASGFSSSSAYLNGSLWG